MARTIEISEETYEKLKDQLVNDPGHALYVDGFDEWDDLTGKSFFFRTVTYHLVGRVVDNMGRWLQLVDASWVADSGRFMNAIKDGNLNEVEPVGEAYINMDTVTDFFPWRHVLPTDQK